MIFKIVGIGEVLWDLLPTGMEMGGAPANFAYHARALGADARVVSRVGNDTLGTAIIKRLESLGVPTYCITTDPEHPTGTVTVEVDGEGQPHFTIHEGVAWDNLEPDPATMMTIVAANAVAFGTLAQRCEPSRSTIRSLLASAPPEALRVLDVNLRQDFFSKRLLEESLDIANVVKLNDMELPVLASLLDLNGSTHEQLGWLAERFSLRLVAYTRGAGGSILHSGGRFADHSGVPSAVRDTVGAGDSFTAAVTLGLLAGWDIGKISQLANEVAAYVCSCEGATPPMPAHLRRHFQPKIISVCAQPPSA